MRLLIVFLLLCLQSWAAPIWELEVEKRAGETITITWDYDLEDEQHLTGWSLYRQTGVSSTPARVATAPPEARSFVITMPTGTTKQYRFFVRPVSGTNIGTSGTEIIVTRIK